MEEKLLTSDLRHLIHKAYGFPDTQKSILKWWNLYDSVMKSLITWSHRISSVFHASHPPGTSDLMVFESNEQTIAESCFWCEKQLRDGCENQLESHGKPQVILVFSWGAEPLPEKELPFSTILKFLGNLIFFLCLSQIKKKKYRFIFTTMQ